MIGTEAFSVSIAGIVVRFEGIPSWMCQRAMLQYQPFLSNESPLNVVRLMKGRDTYLLPERLLRLEQTSYDEGEIMTSPEFAAFRPPDQTGVLRISRPEDVECVLRCMETYLRWSVASLAIHRQAFVLHSAGLVLKGQAYIFCGHSGAGKSTVTALSPAAGVLSDDLVLIHKEGPQWMAATTPFAGSFPQRQKQSGSFPIRCMYALRKSLEVKVCKLDAAPAAGLLLSNCPFVPSAARGSELFPLIENFVQNVPARELYFRKDPSFWDVILQD